MANNTTKLATVNFPKAKMDFSQRDKAFSKLVDSYWTDYYKAVEMREFFSREMARYEKQFDAKIVVFQCTNDPSKELPTEYEACLTPVDKLSFIKTCGTAISQEDLEFLSGTVDLWEAAKTKRDNSKNPDPSGAFGLDILYNQYAAACADKSGVAEKAYMEELQKYFATRGMSLTLYGLNDLNRAIGSSRHSDKDFKKNGFFMKAVSKKVFVERFVQFLSDGFHKVGVLKHAKTQIEYNNLFADSKSKKSEKQEKTTQELHDETAPRREEILESKKQEESKPKTRPVSKMRKSELCEYITNKFGKVVGLEKMTKADLLDIIKGQNAAA